MREYSLKDFPKERNEVHLNRYLKFLEKKGCPNCGRLFDPGNYKKHIKVCVEDLI